MTHTPTLKPCPFCGSSKIYADQYVRDGSGISCGDCNTKIWEYHGPLSMPSAQNRCVDRWNTRTVEAGGVQELVGAARAVLLSNLNFDCGMADEAIIPLDFTFGELRDLRAALSKWEASK